MNQELWGARPSHRPPASRLLLAVLALTAGLGIPGAAAADNPFDAYQRELATQATRQGRRPEGIVPLLQIWRNYPWADPDVTRQALSELAESRRLSPARRAYAAALHARALLRSGDLEGAARLTRELGYVTDFRVIGSFDDEGKRGFAAELPPEEEPMAAWDDTAHYRGKERQVSWRPYPAETTHYGFVSFDSILRPNEASCAFAETFIESEREQPLTLWLGNGGAAKMYWNGELVLEDEIYRQPDPDRHVASVAAHAGPNRLLIKLCVDSATWGFFLRVGDRTGAPASGVSVDASAHDVAEEAPRVRPGRPLRSDLAALEAAAEGDRARPDALEALARYLAYTGADDPAERHARQLAARAAEDAPTVERLALAAALASERGDTQRFAARARELAPDDRDARLLWARVAAGGPSPEDALPLVTPLIEGDDRVAMQAGLLRADLLAQIDMREAALAQVAALAAQTGDAPGFIEAWATRAEGAEHADLAHQLQDRLVGARYDAMSARRGLVLDALRRNERSEVNAQLDALAQLTPDSASSYLFSSQVYEGLGDTERALAELQRARRLAPEDANVILAEGQLLLRMGQDTAAAETFRMALDLRPQDAETRELLEQVEPEDRRDEAYAVDRRELLARRVERSGYSTTVLEELTVNTVFENGLGSSFHQFAAQAHDDEGARKLRTYSIQFDPDTQRVDVRAARVYKPSGRVLEATQTFEQPLGEPWYRIYYDTRALVVVFPTIEPGDTVEIQYRVDDMAHRNLFADYYGDLTFLQGFTPQKRVDYVLITPTSREFFFNEPQLASLEHDRTVDGDTRIDHFHADDVPAIRDEEGMPGMTEVAPYLHVSTYRTWEDVGRWWWGLIAGSARSRRRPARDGGRARPRRARPRDQGAAHPRLGHPPHALRGARVRHPRLQALPRAAHRPARLRRLQGQGLVALHHVP